MSLSLRVPNTLLSIKVSPAAFWHAKLLGIDLKGIKGSGPKGHILKSDVLANNFSNQKDQNTQLSQSIPQSCSFLLEYPSGTSDNLLKKCFERISKNSSIEIKYKALPEISSIQLELMSHNTHLQSQSQLEDVERIKKLARLYLTDSLHLLL